MKKEIRLSGAGRGCNYLSGPATELRLDEGSEGPVLSGYAAVFNVWSENLGGFRERIRPGAFRKTIAESDVLAVIDHESGRILGRTSSSGNPLTLEENEVGLLYGVPLTEAVSYVKDLMANVRAANIRGNSFAFSTVKDQWGTDEEMDWRELIEVKLYDVGPVSQPAYPQTSLGLRALPTEEELAPLRGVMFRIENGRKPRDPDLELLDQWIQRLQSLRGKEEPGPAPHSDDTGAKPYIFTSTDSTGTVLRTDGAGDEHLDGGPMKAKFDELKRKQDFIRNRKRFRKGVES